MDAQKAVAFDIDPWSRENARENTLLNKVDSFVDIRFGGIETVDEQEFFDLILANINRNVLLDMIPSLIDHAIEEGVICLCGLLHSDEDSIRNKLRELPVEVTDVKREEEWILIQTRKVGS